MMMLKKIMFAASFVAISMTALQAQTKSNVVKCEDKITAEFTGPKEEHSYEVNLVPGQVLEAKVIPTGDYLNFRVELFDPVGSEIINDQHGTFGDPNKRNINMKSGTLSGRGSYRVVVYNYDLYGRYGRAGEYSIQFTCINP